MPGESCDLPFIVLRCDEETAAIEGSKAPWSLYGRFSWIEGGMWVGELFFGVVPPLCNRLEKVREMPDTDRSSSVMPEGELIGWLS